MASPTTLKIGRPCHMKCTPRSSMGLSHQSPQASLAPVPMGHAPLDAPSVPVAHRGHAHNPRQTGCSLALTKAHPGPWLRRALPEHPSLAVPHRSLWLLCFWCSCLALAQNHFRNAPPPPFRFTSALLQGGWGGPGPGGGGVIFCDWSEKN